jgi:GNAT superfamily N-acetyltransferase
MMINLDSKAKQACIRILASALSEEPILRWWIGGRRVPEILPGWFAEEIDTCTELGGCVFLVEGGAALLFPPMAEARKLGALRSSIQFKTDAMRFGFVSAVRLSWLRATLDRVYRESRAAQLRYIGVEPSHRNRGAGVRILGLAKEIAKERSWKIGLECSGASSALFFMMGGWEKVGHILPPVFLGAFGEIGYYEWAPQ